MLKFAYYPDVDWANTKSIGLVLIIFTIVADNGGLPGLKSLEAFHFCSNSFKSGMMFIHLKTFNRIFPIVRIALNLALIVVIGLGKTIQKYRYE